MPSGRGWQHGHGDITPLGHQDIVGARRRACVHALDTEVDGGKGVEDLPTREGRRAPGAEDRHFGWLGKDMAELFDAQEPDARWPPRGVDCAAVDQQPRLEAFVADLYEAIVITVEQGCSGTRIRRDIPRQRGAAQGFASNSLISSSLPLKRPCSAIMTGLAM